MLVTFIQSIKRAETPFYAKLKGIIKSVFRLNIPVIKAIHKPLYALHIMVSRTIPFFYIKLWVTPLFKSICASCGTGLKIYNGMPYIEGSPTINLGDNVTFNLCTIATGHQFDTPTLTIGNRSTIGYRTTLSFANSITIGDDVKIAENVFIADNNGHPINPNDRVKNLPVSKSEVKPIVIGDNVWIGRNCVILKGVRIGKNSIIAANTVVVRNVPPNSIVKSGKEEIIRNYPDLLMRF